MSTTTRKDSLLNIAKLFPGFAFLNHTTITDDELEAHIIKAVASDQAEIARLEKRIDRLEDNLIKNHY